MSTDNKPVIDVPVGSYFTETNTDSRYRWCGTCWDVIYEKSYQSGIVERITNGILKRLNVDSVGRLRVSAESVASHAVTLSTLATLTSITNWGLRTATALTIHLLQPSYHSNIVEDGIILLKVVTG